MGGSSPFEKSGVARLVHAVVAVGVAAAGEVVARILLTGAPADTLIRGTPTRTIFRGPTWKDAGRRRTTLHVAPGDLTLAPIIG